VRRNAFAIRGFRRVLTSTVACRRMYRKSGGGGNCTRVPDFATNPGTCGYGNRSYPWSEVGREAESLREVIDSWPSLPPHIVQAILALVRTARG